ncbi:hypothetical protein ACFV0C_21505 [Streptomyces sp. NPDC059568]|uniref:hypothetical protein n=1 Tax=Streptomyces sp. NPDC059568 TaxID=3346868 RepID=UPI0036CC3B82
MNDDLATTQATEAAESASPAPESTAPAPAPALRRRAWLRLGTVLPAVLVLGAIGGGVAFIKTTVDGADRTVPTALWRKPDTEPRPNPDPAEHVAEGRTDTDLSRKLLPVPEDYHLGPDVEEHGNDVSLTAKEAEAMFKSIGDGLPAELRRALNKEIDKLGVKGIAVRSYSADSDDLVVQVFLMRMTDRAAVHRWYETQSDRPGARKGPAVEGYKKARCFLAPKEKKSGLAAMECVAYDGELAVDVVARGTEPFDSSAVAELTKDQLGHIASPGKYV